MWIADPIEAYGLSDIVEEDIPESFELNEWSCFSQKFTDLGKKSRVTGTPWCKGVHTVWILNESQFGNVGNYKIAVVSNEKEAIVAFLVDQGFSNRLVDVEANEVVMQLV